MNRMLERIKYGLKRVVEGNVYIQYYAFHLLYYWKFLLPHDGDYTGVTRLALGDPKSDGILDIGANLGLSALSFRKLLPHVRIFSLEPNPIHRKWLAAIKEKDKNFDYLMVGAGETKGSVTLHIPYYRRIPLHTMAAVHLADLEEACNTLYRGKCRNIHIKTVSAPLIPIDELQLSPELIKIDAEGFEPQVVKGSLETIRRSLPHLLVERSDRNSQLIHQLLAPLGYRGCYWDNKKKNFTATEMDTRNMYFIAEARCRSSPQLARIWAGRAAA